MKIIVCGDRNWTHIAPIAGVLLAYSKDTIVVHGDNGYDFRGRSHWGRPDDLAHRGADKLAGYIAGLLELRVVRFTPVRSGTGRWPRKALVRSLHFTTI